jgi:hypothetical protein
MSRLEAELRRLSFAGDDGTQGECRAAVLELVRPGGWRELAKAWQGVQADLEWPAPGIAVNGSDACQLWFSFRDPMQAAEAQALLATLRSRYLADIPAGRIRFDLHPRTVPPFQAAPDRWSAFVTSDLAALFDEDPWLDLPPGNDAQAELLSRLQPIAGDDLRRAMERLQPAQRSADAPESAGTTAAPNAAEDDARRFLLQVMNDAAVELPLRIEAAKALLSATEGRQPR